MDGERLTSRLQFGPVTLIPSERLVLKDGRAVPLTSKAFDLLALLAANPGRLLTKEQLLIAVWPDAAVEESNLAYHVSAIRKALGEGSDGHRYIETVPKHGYRFVATIVPLDVHGDMSPDSSMSARTPWRASLRAGGLWRWGLAALVTLLVTIPYLAWQSARSASSETALRAVPLTSLPGVVRDPSFSPDGNHVAFTWNGSKQSNPDVYVQQIGGGPPFRLTSDTGNDFSPVWSPDGRSIAFLRQQPNTRLLELRLIAPLGGAERKLTELRPHGAFLRPVTLGWCPDSNCVVVTDAVDESKPVDALFVVSIGTGEKRQLTYPPNLTLADTDPAVSPDGRWLVFRRDAGPFTGQLQLLALSRDLTATGEPRPLTPNTLAAYHPDWMPDSTEIIFSAKGALWKLGIASGSTAERFPFVGADGLMPVVSRPSATGRARLVYVRSFADSNIWRIETSAPGATATAPPVVAIGSTRHDDIPEFSPDGRRVVFTSDRSGELEVWVADVDGGNPIQLTSMGAVPGFARWSPDGKTIAFHSNPDGKPDVFVVLADGGTPRKLIGQSDPGGFPSFSRDGKWIYFASARSGEPVIWKLPTSGGDAVQVSPGVGLLAIESPDGAYLYYGGTTATNQPGPLLRLSFKSGEVVKVLEHVVSTSFALSNGGIYYIERASAETRLKYFDLSTQQSTLVAANLGNVGFGLTASRDGRSILYSRVDSSVDDLMLVENFR